MIDFTAWVGDGFTGRSRPVGYVLGVSTTPPAPPERILIIRPSALGDVCRSVCVLASLRGAFPNARIDWLVQDSFGAAIGAHPMLTRAIPFPRREVALGKLWTGAGRRRLGSFLASLRHPGDGGGYEMVFDCQGLGRSGLFAWWTQAKRRVGYANAREMGWLGVNARHRVPLEMHGVDRMLALVEREGITPVRDMRLYVNEEDAANLDPRLRGAAYAVVAPTSRWPGKRWPAERFAKLISALLDTGGIDNVVIVAGPSERDQCGPILQLAAREPRIVDQIGRTSVGELMAIVRGARLVVANDSAPLHMAVGFDRPLVGLFGPTRIDLVGPYQREADVIQAYEPAPGISHKNDSAGRKMMEAITLERVIHACQERLDPKL